MKEKETRISPGGIKQGRTKGMKRWIRLCIIEGCLKEAQDYNYFFKETVIHIIAPLFN